MVIANKIGEHTKEIHFIFDESPSIKSYAYSLLLKNYFRELDIDYAYKNDWRYYFIVRRHFLRKVRKQDENGKYWECHYCRKRITNQAVRRRKWQPKNIITVDHIVPVSKDGLFLDTSNMVECCSKCNGKKGTKSYKEFKDECERKILGRVS